MCRKNLKNGLSTKEAPSQDMGVASWVLLIQILFLLLLL